MTGLIVTKDPTAPREAYARGLDALPAATGEVFDASAALQWARNATPSILRWGERGVYQPGEADTAWGLDLQPAPAPGSALASPLLSADDANKEFGIDGHLKFDRDTPESVARQLHQLKRDELYRQAVIERSEGISGLAAQLAGGLIAGALDPLNIASAFVPVVGPTRYGLMVAGAGGAAARFGVRAGVGAAEGVVGAAVLEPLVYAVAQSEQADYGAVDSMLNLAFGGVLGGGLHSVGGAVGDKLSGRWRSPVAGRADAAPITDREAALRGGVAAVAEGDLPPAELDAVLRERMETRAAYDDVRAAPFGAADDPLVTLLSDSDAPVNLRRGAAEERDGVVRISGRGDGLVKIIFKDGEGSNRPADRQVTRDDVEMLPQWMREYAPKVEDQADKDRYHRIWIVNHDDGRQIKIVASRFSADRNEYLVKMGVNGADRLEAPSPSRGDAGGAGSPGDVSRVAGDTPAGTSDRSSQGRDAGSAGSPQAGLGTSPADTAPERVASQGGRTEPTKRNIGGRRVQSNVSSVYDGSGRQVNVRYRVRELGDLIVSTTDDFRANPDYPAHLQPRDRARAAGQAQIADIVAKFDPGRLGYSNDAATGAPVIGPDGVVESGNGRSMALRRVYAEHPDKATAYQAELVRKGFSVTGFRQPVLVAERLDEMDAATRKAFTEDAQKSGTLALSPTEQAAVDAGRMGPDVIELHKGGDEGLARNAGFVRAFINKFEQSEQGAFATKDGKLSMGGRRRIRDALTARAYDDVDLLSPMLETDDDGNRALGAALRDIAPRWATMRDRAAAGDIADHVDATGDLLEAVALVRDAVAAERPLNHILSQVDAFAARPSAATEWFVAAMVRGNRMASKEHIATSLNKYLDMAMAQKPDMFGTAPMSREKIVEDIVRRNAAGKTPGERAEAAEASARIEQIIAEAEQAGAAPKIGVEDESLIDGELARFAALGKAVDPNEAAALKQLDTAAEADARALDAAAFCLSRKG